MSGKRGRRVPKRPNHDVAPAEDPRGGALFAQQITSFRVGPLPDPAELEHYERILPGLADRIMSEAERNGASRRALNEKALDGGLAAQRRGFWGALWLGTLLIVGGVVAICLGHSPEGLASIGTAAATIGGAFIYARKKQGDERAAKRREAAHGPPAS